MQTSTSSSGHSVSSTRTQHNQTATSDRRSDQYRDELDSSFYQLPGADDYMQSRPVSVMEPHRATVEVPQLVTTNHSSNHAPATNNTAIHRPQIQTNLPTPAPVSVASHSAPKPASAEFMLCLHQLCDVGFTAEHATIALKRCNNNVEEAITFCLEHDDEAMQQYINEEIVAHDARLHALLGTAAVGFATPTANTATSNNTRTTTTSSTESTIKSKNVFKRMIGLKSKHATNGTGPSIAASPNSFSMPVVAVEPTPTPTPQPTPAISFSTPSRVQVPSMADSIASLSARSTAPPPAMNPGYFGEEREEDLDFSGLDGEGQRDEAVLNYSAMEEEVLLNSVLAESALEARQAHNASSATSDSRSRSGSSITSAAGAAGGAALIRRMGSPRKSTTTIDSANGGLSTSSAAPPVVVAQPPAKPLRPPSMQKMNSSSSSSTPVMIKTPVAPLTPVVHASTALSGAKYVEVTHEVAGSERWSLAVARAAEMSSLQEEEEEVEVRSSAARRPVSSVEDYGALMDIQGMLRQQAGAGDAASLAVIDEIFAPTVAAPIQPVSVFVFPEVSSPAQSSAAPSLSFAPQNQVDDFFPSTPADQPVAAASHDMVASDELSEFGYVVPNIMSSSFYQNALSPAPLPPSRSAMLSAPSVHGLEISDSFEDLVSSHGDLALPTSTVVAASNSSSSGASSGDVFTFSATVEESAIISHASVPETPLPVVAEDEVQEVAEEEDLLRSDRGFARSQYGFPTGDELRDDERYVEEDRVNLSHNSSSNYALLAEGLDSIPEGNTRRSRQNLLAGIDEVVDRNHGLGTKLGGSVLVVPLPAPATAFASHSSASSAAVSSERDTMDRGKTSTAATAFNKPPPPPGPKVTSLVPATQVTSAIVTSSVDRSPPPVVASTPAQIVIIRSISTEEDNEEENQGFEAFTHSAVAAEPFVVTAVSASGYEGDADTLSAEEVEASIAVHGSSDEEEEEDVEVLDAVRRVNEQIQRDEMLERTSHLTDSSHDSSTNLALAASLLDNNAFVASGSNSERSTYSAYAENNSSSSSSAQAVLARPSRAPSPSQQSPATPTALTPLYHEIQTHLRSVHKRKHLACIVNEHNGKFTAQISLKQVKLSKNESSPQGNRSNSVIIGTCTTRELATDLCLTLAPPEWTGKQDSQNCILCNVGFTMFKKGHHCRNCGFIVCVTCSNKAWPSSMLPTTYHDQEKYVRICSSCQTGTELFVRGLRQGDYQSVLSLYASGNVNLHCPISIYVNNAHPVHMAAAGGNLPLLQWLIETKKCSVKDNGTKKQLVTGKGLSVLAVAAQAGHVSIMRYLIHQRKCTVLEITEMSILHRALHVALESPGPMPPYIPPKGANRDDELLSDGGGTATMTQTNSYDSALNGSSNMSRAPGSMAPNGVASSSAEAGYAPHQLTNSSSSSSTPPTGANHSANVTPRTPATSTVPRPAAARTTQLVAPLGPLNGPRAAQVQAAAAAQAASTESIATPGIQLVAPLGPIHGRAVNTNPSTSQVAGAPSPERRLPSYLTPTERQAIVTGASAAPVAATATTGPASPSVHTTARSIVAPRALYNEAPVNIATAEAVTGYAYTTPQTTPNGRGILQNLHNHNNHAEEDLPVAATAFLTSDIIFEVSQHDANFTSQSAADEHSLSVNERHVSVRHIAVASPYVATARGSELAAAPSPVPSGANASYPELIVEGSAAPAAGSSRTNGPRWW